jgi:mannose-6-phosphate isomerase-like protein (cupin superfamily)
MSSTGALCVAYGPMRYAMHESDAADGRLFDAARGCELFTQRTLSLAGAVEPPPADEVLYVLKGSGTATIDGAQHVLKPGSALFVSSGTPWQVDGEVRAVSVLVHGAEPSDISHAVVDLEAVETGTATAGRQFLLGLTPESGCASVTQFVGLVPPGRAPDHFHTYDEVIYVLEGEGTLFIGGEEAELRPGTCVHLPARLVHCLANTGETELRLLGVFRPAGSPAEAYYPDGTPAVLRTEE